MESPPTLTRRELARTQRMWETLMKADNPANF